MKRLNHNNIFSRLLVVEPLNGAAPIYDKDTDEPCVIVSKENDNIESQEKFAGVWKVNVPVYDWEDEKQFNRAVFGAIAKAVELSKRTVSSVEEALKLFDASDLVCARALVSFDGFKKYAALLSTIPGFGPIRYEYDVFCYDEVKDNEIYLFADPEFIGVIPAQYKNENSDKEDLGIGIINLNGIVKVEL